MKEKSIPKPELKKKRKNKIVVANFMCLPN